MKKELNRKQAGTYLSSTREQVLSSREKRKTIRVDLRKPNLWERIKSFFN
jgi:hypothetical protein